MFSATVKSRVTYFFIKPSSKSRFLRCFSVVFLAVNLKKDVFQYSVTVRAYLIDYLATYLREPVDQSLLLDCVDLSQVKAHTLFSRPHSFSTLSPSLYLNIFLFFSLFGRFARFFLSPVVCACLVMPKSTFRITKTGQKPPSATPATKNLTSSTILPS